MIFTARHNCAPIATPSATKTKRVQIELASHISDGVTRTGEITMIAITLEANQPEVRPLSSSEWIVSDVAVARNEGLGAVAYVESRLGVFELLEPNKPADRNYFDSLSAAIASIGYSASRAG